MIIYHFWNPPGGLELSATWRDSLFGRESAADPDLQSEAWRLMDHAAPPDGEGFLGPTSGSVEPDVTVDLSLSRSVKQPDDAPAFVGKYRIVRPLGGTTGQGAAYLAEDPDAQRHVVVKRYHSDPGERPEAAALARVQSPFVPRCLGIDFADGEPFLVLEYVPGRTLAEVRNDGPIDPKRAAGIVAQLAQGAAAVHVCGLIHRDIKPANVILHDDGTPRLVDFGLAAYLGSERLRTTSGTPAYMAPEQARGEWDRIDPRTDVFALGAILYFLLSGRAPYTGKDAYAVLEEAKKAVIAAPRTINPTIPAAIERVCLRALSAAPEARYGSANEFATALLATTGRVGRLRRRALAATGLLVILLLGVGGWVQSSRTADAVRVDPPERPRVSGPIASASGMEVFRFRNLGDGVHVESLGVVTDRSLAVDPPRLNDVVKVRAELGRPGYFYLIALNPDGKDQLCLSSGQNRESSRDLTYPSHAKDYFGLTDGIGAQVFVLVESDEPLPAYEAWKAKIPGGLAWTPLDHDSLWTYDSDSVDKASGFRPRVRGVIVQREAAAEQLVNLCDRLKMTPGVTGVRAVAFPVKPVQEILK